MFNKKNFLIVGVGYVGSASAIHLSLLGHRVQLWDKKIQILKNWSELKIPFQDKDLQQGLKKLARRNNLPKALKTISDTGDVDVVLICVGTPVNKKTGYDLKQVEDALKTILEKNLKNVRIVIRSTLPPNCMREKIYPLIKKYRKPQTPSPEVIYFPEFLREGSALKDLKNAPLFVVGSDKEIADPSWITECFDIPANRLVITKTNVAEMLKVTCNVFHALKVCFSNEIAAGCAKLNIDSHEVMNIFCQDHKLNISSAYLRPGFSYGGPCLDKELLGLSNHPLLKKEKLPILKNIALSNQAHFKKIVQKLTSNKKKYKAVGILGVSFKARSLDTRNSPVVQLIDEIKTDFQLFSFKETYSPLVEKFNFISFLDCIDVLILGSAELTQKQKSILLKKKIPIIDLCLNFENRLILKNSKNYSSIIDADL